MQMTISPPTSSLGMEPYYVQPILLKSDHFSDLESSSNPAAKFSQQTPKPGYFCKSLWSHYLLLRLISLCITLQKVFFHCWDCTGWKKWFVGVFYTCPRRSPGTNVNNSESSEQAMTSDESQEAMRLFAASPPEGMFQQGGHQVR